MRIPRKYQIPEGELGLYQKSWSADPFIPRPTMTQSWNRYAHVYNNPLTYTDPMGYEPDYALGDDSLGNKSW